MDVDLIRVIRDHYPFPIAHAHKKTLAQLDDDIQKLKCLLQTAETTIQFLALLMLAQLHRDLEHGQAPALVGGKDIKETLRKPSFGTWNGMLRDVLKGYRDHRHLLFMPELFDFYFRPSRGKNPQVQPVVEQAINPLITLRNRFAHSSETLSPDQIDAGMRQLGQLLTALHFLSKYELAFVLRIEVRHPTRDTPCYRHSLMQMSGCFSIFDRRPWESDIVLQQERVIVLDSADGRSLFLDPFVTVADPIPVPGVFDVFLLHSAELRRAHYASSQFGRELRTDRPDWTKGKNHLEDLERFFDLLRNVPLAEEEVELEGSGATLPVPEEERATPSIEEVFAARYKRQAPARQHVSPYKFLDYFEPEDADLFFGREQEIRQLQRKFYAARLLILHGESGTGKTSLIRAGLLPRLSPESYVPVYVRVLEEPTRAIKEAMLRQLKKVDQRHLDLPLVPFLDVATANLSKTVVLILDQFEEFFLRFPPAVRQAFHRELAACVTAANLDVHVIIALRDDYFALLAEFQETMPDIFTHEMHLARLTMSQALAAAVEPVKQVGLAIDETLMEEVVLPQLDEPGQGIAPPLLQIVCDALYQHAQDASRSAIGAEDYAAIGDVRQALVRYLDTTLRQFGAQQPLARAVLKALVTAEGTKRASFVEEIVSRLQTTGMEATAKTVEQNVLHKLVQMRLVRADDVDGHARYELTHEFLVQQIGGWIAESERELTKILELIDRAYEAYRATNLLLQPEALALIAPFQEQLVLPADKRTFLERSRHTAQQRWRRLLLKVGMLLLVVALGISGVFGWQLHRRYKEARQNAQHAVNVNDVLWELMERLQPAINQDPVLAHILEPGLKYAEGEFERLLQNASGNPAVLASKLRMLLVSSAVIQSSGNTDQALSRVDEARTIAERLISQHPLHRRDLALSHMRIGDVLEKRGELEGALVAYRESLAITERLVDLDPNSTQWLHDLALSYARIGNVLRQQKNLEGALVAYQYGLVIAERLEVHDPTDTQWQHTRAVMQHHIGRIFFDTGKPQAAADALYNALRRYEALTQQYPGNTTFAQALFDVYHLLGKLHAQQRNFAEALPAYRQAVETIERLAQHDPRITQWQQELAKALNILAWALLTAAPADLRQPAEALAWAHRAVELSAQSSPVEQAMRLDTLAMAYHVHGDHPQAITAAEHALRLLPPMVTEGDTLAVEVRQELETHRRCFILHSDSSRLVADTSCPCCVSSGEKK